MLRLKLVYLYKNKGVAVKEQLLNTQQRQEHYIHWNGLDKYV